MGYVGKSELQLHAVTSDFNALLSDVASAWSSKEANRQTFYYFSIVLKLNSLLNMPLKLCVIYKKANIQNI